MTIETAALPPYTEHCARQCTGTDKAVRCFPLRVQPQGSGVRAWYRCPRCLYSWWTSWERWNA